MEKPSEADAVLNRLVEQYQTALRRMCYMMLRDEELAKDAVQETFLKAYRNIGIFRGDCSEKTWLMRIAVNTCRDVKRSAWFRMLDRRITPDDLPEPAVQPAEGAVELTMEIMRLPPKAQRGDSALLLSADDHQRSCGGLKYSAIHGGDAAEKGAGKAQNCAGRGRAGMKPREEQIQTAIDAVLSGLKDDPQLAQRVIRAAR